MLRPFNPYVKNDEVTKMAVSGFIKIGGHNVRYLTITGLCRMVGDGWSVNAVCNAIPKGSSTGVFTLNGYEVSFNRNSRGYGTGKRRTTLTNAVVLAPNRKTEIENVTIRQLSQLSGISKSTLYYMLRLSFHERAIVMFAGVMVVYADDTKSGYKWPVVSREEIRKSFSARVLIGGKSVLREA